MAAARMSGSSTPAHRRGLAADRHRRRLRGQLGATGVDALRALGQPAGETPHELPRRSCDRRPGSESSAIDPPRAAPIDAAEHVFQPLISPNGALAIFWTGRMERVGDEWLFSEGGAPWLAEHRPDGAGTRCAFPQRATALQRPHDRSRRVHVGGDHVGRRRRRVRGVGRRTGPACPSGRRATYPDPARVYFGHATDPRGLTQIHAIDADDLPTDWLVVDVKVSPTGQHLVVTVAQPLAGDLDAADAPSCCSSRATPATSPTRSRSSKSDDGSWFGPAAFDVHAEVDSGDRDAVAHRYTSRQPFNAVRRGRQGETR